MAALRRSTFDPNTFEDTIIVSSAEILALNATPKTLIAAPGAGKYLIVDAIEAINVYGTSTYSTDATGVDILYNGGATIVNLTQTWAQAVANRVATAPPGAVDVVPSNTAIIIQALVSDPTTGDGDWTIHVIYRVVP